MFSRFTDALKYMSDKVTGLFEKKTDAEIASEKASNAKKIAGEQMQKTTDAISDVASGVKSSIVDASKDACDKANDLKQKASNKVGEIEESMESQTDLASKATTKAFDDFGKAKDHVIEKTVEKFDEVKASAYTSFEKGFEAVENAFN